jgi:protein translocase SecG subunit|tara:strand:- start:856 stop:1074 length:219 start_codon:yes stop_codon:yes gene_type:complete
MILLEKVWFLISILIIVLILSTDPKSSTTNGLGNQFSAVFASASDGQKFIKQLNWALITAFFLITVGLSYVA